ncbi:MAG: pyrimidine/purine nucleoside phosphorylase [Armatimonadetes bacterium]|nr:pyrimidine/purine nucleoside phosphorylase [Armatimonadota bacterium]
MSKNTPAQFDGVSVVCKANVYFDGKVVSHTILFPDGTKKSLGLIYPGTYTFNTGAPENMAIIAGSCRVRVAGAPDWVAIPAGEAFDVVGNSSFEIAVDAEIAEYVCSFG